MPEQINTGVCGALTDARRRPPHRRAAGLAQALAMLCLAGVLAGGLATPVRAQPAARPVTGAAEAELLQALGQRAGISALVSDFVDRLLVDPRSRGFFDGVKPPHLKQQISDQICQLLGGGCDYDGETMKNAHAGLKLPTAELG